MGWRHLLQRISWNLVLASWCSYWCIGTISGVFKMPKMPHFTSGKIWHKISKENQQRKPFSSSDTQSVLSPSRYDLQLTRQLKSAASVLWWIKSKEFTVYAHKIRQNKRMHHGCSGSYTSCHRTAGMVTPEQPIGQQQLTEKRNWAFWVKDCLIIPTQCRYRSCAIVKKSMTGFMLCGVA